MSRIAERFMPAAYGGLPGYKEPTTSKAAAIAIKPKAAALQEYVLAAIVRSPAGLTADEAASAIGESILSTRPRLSELRADTKLVPTGERRRNASGQMAKVWIDTKRGRTR